MHNSSHEKIEKQLELSSQMIEKQLELRNFVSRILPFAEYVNPYRQNMRSPQERTTEYKSLSTPTTSSPSDSHHGRVGPAPKARSKLKAWISRMRGEGRWDGQESIGGISYDPPRATQNLLPSYSATVSSKHREKRQYARRVPDLPAPNLFQSQLDAKNFITPQAFRLGMDIDRHHSIQDTSNEITSGKDPIDTDSSAPSHDHVRPRPANQMTPLSSGSDGPLPSLPAFMDQKPRLRRRLPQCEAFIPAYGLQDVQLFEVEDPSLSTLSVLRISECR
jgi:hypothetical protein